MRKKQCKADLGTSYVIGDASHFPCEREPHDDEWHERWSAPIAARWREPEPGHRIIEFGASRAGGSG